MCRRLALRGVLLPDDLEQRPRRRAGSGPEEHPADWILAARGGNYDSKRRGKPLEPGRFYDVTFDLEPDHQVIPPGKQLAVLIMSSDPEFTLWPTPGTMLTVDLARSSFAIPIVGGAAALSRASVM